MQRDNEKPILQDANLPDVAVQAQAGSDAPQQEEPGKARGMVAGTGGGKGDPDRLGNDRIGKLLAEFSVPAIVMMVFNSLYNLIDTIVLQVAVPSVGAAVTQLAFPMMSILMGCSTIAGVGGNALAAIELGKGNRKLVEKVLGNTSTLLIAMGVLAAIVGTVFIDPLLVLLGTTDELWEPTKVFMQIIMIGFVLQSLGMGLNNFLRTAGKPNFALATSVLGTIACLVFNLLLVLGMGLGIAGSALATIIGQGIGMIPVIWYLVASENAPFHLRAGAMVPDFKLSLNILSLGLASFVVQCGGAVVTLVLNHVINLYAATDPVGVTNAFATISIAWKVLGLVFTTVLGITMGAQPILGYNIGARAWSRVLSALKWSCIGAAALATVGWLALELFPELILGVFSIGDDLMDFASTAMRIMALWLPVVGYQVMGSSYFQSSGQPLKATVLELTRQILFLVPLYLLFPPVAMELFGVTGLMGVLLCVPVSDMLATIVTTVFVVLEVKKLRRHRDRDEAAGRQAAAADVSAGA